jgi:hypothetical protein
MFYVKDLGTEVKVVEATGTRTRGVVSRVGTDEVEVRAEQGPVVIKFNKISTVTRIGDFSS